MRTLISLIGKDLRIYGRKAFLQILPGFLILATVFIFRYYQWHVFMMYGYITASLAVIQYGLQEAHVDNAVLTNSLPVSRKAVVLSRYLTGMLLFAIYLAIWYTAGRINTYLFPNATTDFSNALQLKSVFISTTYTVTFLSIYLPGTLIFRSAGVIATSVPAFLAAVISVPILFYPFEISYVPIFLPSDQIFIIVMSASLLAGLSASMLLSFYFFKKKNL